MKGKNKRSQIKRDVAAEIIYPTIIRFVIFLLFCSGKCEKASLCEVFILAACAGDGNFSCWVLINRRSHNFHCFLSVGFGSPGWDTWGRNTVKQKCV